MGSRSTPIIEKFKAGIDEALAKREVIERMQTLTIAPQPMPAAGLMQFLAKEKAFWTDVIEKSGAKPN